MPLSQSIKHFFGFDLNKEEKVSTPSPAALTPSNELVHINQEMYKKSAELSEKNKTLAVLEEINELILSSITNVNEVAKAVTKLLVSEVNYTIVAIFLYDKQKNVLKPLARSQNGTNNTPSLEEDGKNEISLEDPEKLVAQAILKRQPLFADSTAKAFPEQFKNNEGIKSVFVAPLIVREELIGAFAVALTEERNTLSEYRLDLLNRLVGVIGIGLDNAMLYNQVQAANEQLQVANVKLKELDKLKNEFVSVASHELRTPMTAIKSYLWMALEGKGGELSEKQKYYIDRGYQSVDRLIRLVNDMLNISRIESGRITIDLQSTNLVKLCQEVIDEVLPRAKEVGVAIEMQKPDLLPLVLADQDKVKEVLINLIGNSLKFTPKDGKITLSFSQKDDFIETRVTDTGAGIVPEDKEKLFQKFGLLEGSYITNQTSTHMGTGLGLYICRSIINLHHGEIKAESEGRGKGSTFSFTLKIYKESDVSVHKEDTTQNKKDTVALIHAEL